MKTLILSLTLLAANAAYAADFYQCDGFAGVDEYRAGISLSKKKAGFFDNDATTYLNLTKSEVLESHPPQVQHTFEGPENYREGSLKLIFNETRLEATLITINGQGLAKVLGEAPCRAEARAWDMEGGF